MNWWEQLGGRRLGPAGRASAGSSVYEAYYADSASPRDGEGHAFRWHPVEGWQEMPAWIPVETVRDLVEE